MTAKQICAVTAFLLIGALLFAGIQDVFIPEWNGNGGCGKLFSGLQALDENTLDAVFVGNSLVYCGISPMKIYEDTKIRSYNLGTSDQSLPAAYFILKEVFEHQNPKVVMLEPGNFFRNDVNQFFYRIVMDNLYYTKTGLEMAVTYNELFGEGMAVSLLPMATYHGDWKSLKAEDFRPDRASAYYSMGYYMTGFSAPITASMEAASRQHLQDLQLQKSEEEQTAVSEQVETWFPRIVQLCRENGAELIVAKLPSFRSALYGGWTEARGAAAAAFVRQHGVEYLDLSEQNLTDVAVDTLDGTHLNIRGAEKVSAWLGQYLQMKLPAAAAADDAQFVTELEKYRSIRDAALLQSETDFVSYLQLLQQNGNRWSVAITGGGDFLSGLEEADFLALQMAGFQRITQVPANGTYAAVTEMGSPVFEKADDHFINNTMKTQSGHTLTVTSASKYDVAVEEKQTTLSLSSTSLCQGREGLNFLVWDRLTGLPLDSKNFATGSGEKQAFAVTGTLKGYLSGYEAQVCGYRN